MSSSFFAQNLIDSYDQNLAPTTPQQHTTRSSHCHSMPLASIEDIQKSLENPNTVILDVRTTPEIKLSGMIQVEGHQWYQCACSPVARDLNINTDDWDKTACVIVHCRSGHRSSAAKRVLEARGFENVLDGGGYSKLKKSLGL